MDLSDLASRCRRALRAHLPEQSAVRWTALAWVPSLLWLAALWPGVMSPDSLWVWGQAEQGGWTDIQPPAYTALMWISQTFTGSPALLAMGQSLLLAAGVVAVARALVRLGAPKRLVIVVAVIVVVTPMFGSFSVMMWKDVPYGAALVFVGARSLDLINARLRGDRDGATTALTMVGVWLAVATLMRQNGIIVAGIILVIAALALRGLRVRALVTLLGVGLVLLFCKTVVYPVTGIVATPEQPKLATNLHDIAKFVADAPDVLTAEDRRLLRTIAPVSEWRDAYRISGCYEASWEFTPGFRWDKIDANSSEWRDLWLRLLVEHPGVVLRNRLCVGEIGWKIDPVTEVLTVYRASYPNKVGLETDPLVEPLNDVAVRAIEEFDGRGVKPFVWHAPPWIYLADLAIVVAAIRRRRAILLFAAAPMFAQQASVTMLNPSPDARYMMGAQILAWLLLPIAFVSSDDADGDTDAPDETESTETSEPRDAPVAAGPDGPGTTSSEG